MIRLLNKNSDLLCSQESSRVLVLKTVSIHTRHVLHRRSPLEGTFNVFPGLTSFGRDVKLGVPCLDAACTVGLN